MDEAISDSLAWLGLIVGSFIVLEIIWWTGIYLLYKLNKIRKGEDNGL